MKNYFLISLVCVANMFLLSSCTIKRTVKVEKQSFDNIKKLYDTNKIPLQKVLIIKNPNSYNELGNKDLNSLSQVLIFNKNGKQVKYFNEETCNDDTKEYIENYNPNIEETDFLDYTISEYSNHLLSLFNFEPPNFEHLSKNIVFVNTAIFGNVLGINKKSFKLQEYNNENFEVYFINLDIPDTWNVDFDIEQEKK